VNDAPEIRLATPTDLPALCELIPLSVRGLSRGFYSDAQIESAIRHIFGPDTQLIADRTYFVATVVSVFTIRHFLKQFSS